MEDYNKGNKKNNENELDINLKLIIHQKAAIDNINSEISINFIPIITDICSDAIKHIDDSIQKSFNQLLIINQFIKNNVNNK